MTKFTLYAIKPTWARRAGLTVTMPIACVVIAIAATLDALISGCIDLASSLTDTYSDMLRVYRGLWSDAMIIWHNR